MKQLSKKEIFVLNPVENTRTEEGKIKQLCNIILKDYKNNFFNTLDYLKQSNKVFIIKIGPSY